MARKVVVTAAELAALKVAQRHFPVLRDRGKLEAALAGLIVKVEAPVEAKVSTGLGLREVERALEGCTKYARWIAGNPGRHLLTLQGAGATQEQITKVGRWLDAQLWMRGRWTLGSLASKWGEWVSQAVVAEPSVTIGSAPAGFAE